MMSKWNFYNNCYENDNRYDRQRICNEDRRIFDCGCKKEPCSDNCSCDCDCLRCPPGPQGPAGPRGPQGPAGGVLNYADFYALMPPDNSATVAPGTDVSSLKTVLIVGLIFPEPVRIHLIWHKSARIRCCLK